MSIRLIIGDCREKLRDLPDASVNCCVTSPPYFGLRDYGTAQWEGGSPGCEHKPKNKSRVTRAASGLQGGIATVDAGNVQRDCHCGARRIDRQMGLEPTPDEFVAGMVEVFREVRRVLRDDGTLWLNIGDSYAGSWCAQARGSDFLEAGISTQQVMAAQRKATRTGSIPRGSGLKPKDLIGIPWMLAFALRADGWYLRQEIIWHKPNPMPESVRDRCTKAHEQIFLLSKSARYYYDQDAIIEPATFDGPNAPDAIKSPYGQGFTRRSGNKDRKPGTARGCPEGTGSNVCGSVPWEGSTRNKRSVWEVATQPFGEAHFATYPPALIEPCILAGSPKGGTVLDPFGGAGTTGLVADRLGRNAILIELNPEYAGIAERRLNADSPLFAEVKAA